MRPHGLAKPLINDDKKRMMILTPLLLLGAATVQPAGGPPAPLVAPVAPPAPPAPPASIGKPRVRARANLASYISDGDYPPSAIRAREQGTVRFVLDVLPDGRVGACRIASSSGSAALDEASCRIMTARAQFTPARDARGRPVADRVTNRIRWVLPQEDSDTAANPDPGAYLSTYVAVGDYPREALRRGEQGRVGFELDVSTEGRALHCRITKPSGSAILDSRTCELMLARARFAPARDANGNLVGDVVAGSIDWVLPPR